MIKPSLLLCILSVVCIKSFSQTFTLTSPTKNIEVNVENADRLSYSIRMGQKVIILNSEMGFKFKNEPDMGSNLILVSQNEKEINETWEPVIRSKHASITDHCRELTLCFAEKTGLKRKMDVQFRAYDEGVAFRYQLYRSEKIGNRHLTRELTGFKFEGNPKAWVADYRVYVSSREANFVPRLLNSIPDTSKIGLPLLIEIDKTHYAAITEAKIDNFPGFYIGYDQQKGSNVNLITKLSPLPLENEDGVKARFSDKQYTPWRVIMLGKSPGDLIESEIIQNLNDPCALKDVSWIKPGISAWDNWWSADVKQDMPTIKQYIDLAGKQGWPYMIMDWQWYGPFDTPEANLTKTAPQLNMEELLQYAKERKVKLWLWMTSGDANRNNNFEEAFALYEKWGIAGVKIDFMDRDDQEMVNWYKEILKTAARHHLMVDFHGAYKPDGIIRTYPNMMTREGVLGEEYSKFSNSLSPKHNVTIPFTRMLAGQMDYTPGGFLNVTKAQYKGGTSPTQVMNTRCAELAKFVIYESPFTVYSDHPDHILNQPGAEFLKDVPTVWDDIHVLSGYPGEYIALAKRTGEEFYLGAMTNSEGRTIKLKLDFLPAGKFELVAWADASDADINATNLIKSKKTITSKDTITIKMASGGGYAAKITPMK